MRDAYKAIFEPLQLQSGKHLKNRMVMAPMGHLGSLTGGYISEEELAYYDKRVRDVGMVITSATTIKEGTHYPGLPAVETDEHIPGLRKLSAVLKSHGAAAVMQLLHEGANGSGEAPSAVVAENSELPLPRELSDTEIESIIKKFGDAARRAIEAGFDGVEIHGANGFLVQQFTSPHYNRRMDRWGGTSENRLAFPLAVINEVKRVVAESEKPFIIGYRISPEEAETNGLTMADTIRNVDMLADQGLDYIHVSLHQFWSKPRRGTNDTRSRMEILKEVVGDRTALIGVGEIKTPEDAAMALSTGVELLAIARGLLLDPEWVQKVHEENEDLIKKKLYRGDQLDLMLPNALWKMIENFIPFED
ncbi:2,4-dienoyl-CoA reductase-like NADH-dependent reductase (Old Yellow Enzyme family) [Paenibacillus endophyticus]|uniref:2,4-dienoyl-CoA reductase-like NADH-dependent reductase (Old Yellow Enzyme family) n=1 Tax=Paenibacillus endophyticus TaxID=1294268 RepID=A0A7W5CCT5_9BACL|nr:NADH-dependent flavin oxidoreductase [Paenibacillus endophyticus]MBB3155373.1 2,4-dienoyl-CoA reductase-like NADH-dependent reductase (Old Yellow Enzyme family) [Paenibacillus endophyticus]